VMYGIFHLMILLMKSRPKTKENQILL